MHLNYSDSIEKHRIKIDKLLNHNAELPDQEGDSANSLQHEPIRAPGTNSPSFEPKDHISIRTQQHTRSSPISIASLISTTDSKDKSNPRQLPSLFQHTETRRSLPELKTSSAISAPYSPAVFGTTYDYRYAQNLHTANGAAPLPSYTYPQMIYSFTGINPHSAYAVPPTGTSNICTTFINEPQFHHAYNRPILSKKKRRGNLPKEVTDLLKRWLIMHKSYPYPTEREKQQLADETGLMVSQISNWFINARRRILQPLLESERNAHTSTAPAATSSTINYESTVENERTIESNNGSTIPTILYSTHQTNNSTSPLARIVTPALPDQFTERRTNIDQPRNHISNSPRLFAYENHQANTLYSQLSIADAENRRPLLQHPTVPDQNDTQSQQPSISTSTLNATPSAASVKLPPMKILDKDLDAFRSL